MIKVIRNRIDDNSWFNYILKDNEKEVDIIYMDNGDLYFCSNGYGNSQEAEFVITKENMTIYSLFNELFNEFKNTKIFKSNDYHDLFKDNTITWISDESVSDDINSADALRIIKGNDYYKLKFTYYEDEYPFIRSIRIRNSRSRYFPFNSIMMNFFIKLQDYNPDYHQIHIEEYLSYKKLILNKTTFK